MCKYATCHLAPFNLSMPSFRVKAFKLPVNKDSSKVQHNRDENNIPAHKPFTVEQQTKKCHCQILTLSTFFGAGLLLRDALTALTSNVSPKEETVKVKT